MHLNNFLYLIAFMHMQFTHYFVLLVTPLGKLSNPYIVIDYFILKNFGIVGMRGCSNNLKNYWNISIMLK